MISNRSNKNDDCKLDSTYLKKHFEKNVKIYEKKRTVTSLIRTVFLVRANNFVRRTAAFNNGGFAFGARFLPK
jgi:hypothetical protein